MKLTDEQIKKVMPIFKAAKAHRETIEQLSESAFRLEETATAKIAEFYPELADKEFSVDKKTGEISITK